ncbi:MAG: DUF1295 domain-containing protein, partial [Pyrinomonadaceae bacterium]|nr:DUF1295 domain-containing protein [Sphingobacteriaceae bacterium]
VDIFWSYNFPVIAVILYVFADGLELRKILICSMVLIAGLRLGTHLLFRVASHLDEEEGRYKQLRKDWAPHADKRFFWFFQMQGISNVILALPFFIIAINKDAELHLLEYVAVGIWLLSVFGEGLADYQLSRFKKNPANKGKVCEVGLWRYSRHPNYFFQWCLWVSYFVFALASPYGFLGIISPLIILHLLTNVTGIPPTEEQAVRSKGEAYTRYQQTTSALVPWFRKMP